MMEASRTFPPELTTPGEARRFVDHVLAPVHADDETSQLALVLTSELVTNAVVHARTELRVRVQLNDEQLRVEVADGDTVLPRPAEVGMESSGGRGLFLVQALAAAWGTRPRPGGAGKVVWFTLPHQPPEPERSRRAGQGAHTNSPPGRSTRSVPSTQATSRSS